MRAFFSIVLLALVAFACDKAASETAPSDALYKRWKAIETGREGKDWRAMETPETIEFGADGTIRYENREHLCCSPVKVSREGAVLKVLEFGGKGDAYCATVLCAAVSELQILSVSDTELVIDYRFNGASSYSVRYVAAP
jgi:hypothetical protein